MYSRLDGGQSAEFVDLPKKRARLRGAIFRNALRLSGSVRFMRRTLLRTRASAIYPRYVSTAEEPLSFHDAAATIARSYRFQLENPVLV